MQKIIFFCTTFFILSATIGFSQEEISIAEKQVIRKYAVGIANQMMNNCHLEDRPRNLQVDIQDTRRYKGSAHSGYYIDMKLSWIENPFFPQKRSAEGCLSIDEYGCNVFFFVISDNIPNLFGTGCLTRISNEHKETIHTICPESNKYYQGQCVN